MSTKSKKRREAKNVSYQARREEHMLKNNNAWADCDNMYAQCAQLLGLPATIAPLAEQPDVIRHMEDMKLFSERCQQLAKDIGNMSEKLTAIHDQHKHLTGSAKGADQFTLAIQIYEQYIQFMEVYSAVCKPVFDEIMEMISRAGVLAENQTKQDEVQTKAQDPNYLEPIDVAVKEA